MINERSFLALPSKKKSWYYLEVSKVTIQFFIENLLTSRYKVLNIVIQLFKKIFPLDKLIALLGNQIHKIENTAASAVTIVTDNLNVTKNHVIIRRSTWNRKNNKFSLFIFNGKSEVPIAMAKCLLSPSSARLEEEFSNMKKIAGYFNKKNISVPHPIKLIKKDDLSIYVEQFAEGIALNDLGNRAFSPRHRLNLYYQGFEAVEHVLDRFADLKTNTHNDVYDKFVTRVLEEFEKSSELTKLHPYKLKKLKDRAIKINYKCLPSIPMHGDLWGGSILMKGNSATVIDWEFFQMDGIPLWDLFMYFIHPGFVLKGRNKGLFSEFLNYSQNKNVLEKLNTILKKQQEKYGFTFEDIELLFQTFLIYHCMTRDTSIEKNWEKCLNHYWINQSLWVEN